jgi:hypothetical protein
MIRRTVVCVTVTALGLIVLSGSSLATPAPAGGSRPNIVVQELLNTPVDFKGVDDPKTTLDDMIGYIYDNFGGVRLEVNEDAFAIAGAKDVQLTPIAERPLPRMRNVTVSTVLRKILTEVSKKQNVSVTWIVRGDVVEITTVDAVRKEFYPGRLEGPFPPLVHADIEKLALADALKLLGDQTGGNVVLDVRAGEKGKTPVTARFSNVPLDTAVRLLADMADLRSVEVEGVLYVTSKENATALRKEQAESQGLAGESIPLPAVGPLEEESNRLLKDRRERLKALLNEGKKSVP